MTKRNNSKFDLGKVEVTTYAKLALQRSGEKVEKFLQLHQGGSFGEVTDEEVKQNNTVIANPDMKNKMILSAYSTSFNEEMIWVVTDLIKGITVVFRPYEYDAFLMSNETEN